MNKMGSADIVSARLIGFAALVGWLVEFKISTSAPKTLAIAVLSTIAAVVYVLAVLFLAGYVAEASRVSHPPGSSLQRFAEFCVSKKTVSVVLEPTLSDMRLEHEEALAAGHPWLARMVLVRGYWSFWSAVAAQLPISFARRVYEVWKATKAGT